MSTRLLPQVATCPLCGSQVPPLQFAPHTRQCELDCASEVIEACDRQILAIHNTVPRGPEHALLQDLEIAWLTEERTRAYCTLFGFDGQGRGTMATDAPGWPDDGMPF